MIPFEHSLHSNVDFENKPAMNYNINSLIYNCDQNSSDGLELIKGSPRYITKISYRSARYIFTGATSAVFSSGRYQNNKFYGRFR